MQFTGLGCKRGSGALSLHERATFWLPNNIAKHIVKQRAKMVQYEHWNSRYAWDRYETWQIHAHTYCEAKEIDRAENESKM